MQIRVPKALFGIFSLATILGFADAVYLTIYHYSNIAVPCYIGSCEKVLSSPQAVMFGIPVAVYGVAYYFAVLLLLAIYFESKNATALMLAACATPLGFLASAYFFYLQAAVIDAWCQYCLFSAFTSTVMFACGIYLYFTHRSYRLT
jgi:uncharacterized membrane protein